MNKSSSAGQRIFCPSLRYEKWEIHTVFPHFPYLVWRQNLSLPVLVDLIRASLTVQTDAKSQKYLLIRFPQSVLHTHPSKLYRDKAADRYPPRPIESCQNGQAARLPSNFPSGIHPAFSGEMAYQGQTAAAQPFCQLSDTADNGTAVKQKGTVSK